MEFEEKKVIQANSHDNGLRFLVRISLYATLPNLVLLFVIPEMPMPNGESARQTAWIIVFFGTVLFSLLAIYFRLKEWRLERTSYVFDSTGITESKPGKECKVEWNNVECRFASIGLLGSSPAGSGRIDLVDKQNNILLSILPDELERGGNTFRATLSEHLSEFFDKRAQDYLKGKPLPLLLEESGQKFTKVTAIHLADDTLIVPSFRGEESIPLEEIKLVEFIPSALSLHHGKLIIWQGNRKLKYAVVPEVHFFLRALEKLPELTGRINPFLNGEIGRNLDNSRSKWRGSMTNTIMSFVCIPVLALCTLPLASDDIGGDWFYNKFLIDSAVLGCIGIFELVLSIPRFRRIRKIERQRLNELPIRNENKSKVITPRRNT